MHFLRSFTDLLDPIFGIPREKEAFWVTSSTNEKEKA
jgi:hypothetical protein